MERDQTEAQQTPSTARTAGTPVGGKVLGVPAAQFAGLGMPAQGGNHLVDAPLVEFLAPLPDFTKG